MMPQKYAKMVLGLVGGIGSGKSQAAAELARQGGHLIIADRLGHEALMEPDVKKQVIERFGQGIVDEAGAIDRQKLGPLVFANQRELRALEKRVFPYIEKRLLEEIVAAQQLKDKRFVVLDAAIMMETGWSKVCDKLIFVDASRPLRLERVARQRGWTEKEVLARETMQMDVAEKKQRADFVIDNGQSLDAIPGQVRDILLSLGLAAPSA
jgi:dephospho-CoA kinase